ncbi:MAG: OmpA family protein [Nitrospinota bacterium]|nr:OmpA family protein [Nitrospinota bacterium]
MAKVEKKQNIVPLWYVTFADLSTLMLTFFVLLLSFANFDIIKFKDMLGSVKDAFGVTEERVGKVVPYLSGEESFQSGKKKEKEISAEQKAELQADAQSMETLIKDSQLAENTSIFIQKNEIVIRVDGGVFFKSGTSEISPPAFKLLNNLAEILKRSTYYLTVEGHTDNMPIKTELFPSNWELSGVRATTILRYLVKKGIDVDRLRAIGLADTHPVMDNESPEGRSRNRRVEFILKKMDEEKKVPAEQPQGGV